jgi:SAM-dependent methyltransferase
VDLEQFQNPKLTPYSLDSYHARSGIVAAVREALPLFKGTILDVGCGRMPYRDLLMSVPGGVTKYLGLDLREGNYQNTPDLIWRAIPLPDNSADSAIATEVLEHFPDPAVVLGEIWRVMRPGGVLLVTVPFLWRHLESALPPRDRRTAVR